MFESTSSLRAEWIAACDASESMIDSGASARMQREADDYVLACHAAFIAASEREAATSVDDMERSVSVTITELSSGALMARADGPAGVWYAVSRTSYAAIGDACASAAYGDACGDACMDPAESVRYFYGTRY